MLLSHAAPRTARFTAYTLDGFGERQHRQLAEMARDLVRCGAFVMLSNSDTPLVHELYSGFSIHRVSRRGTINADVSKRGAVPELIITGGYRVDS